MPMRKRIGALSIASVLISLLNLLAPASAPALTFNSAPARYWGHTFKATYKDLSLNREVQGSKMLGEKKSEWKVSYTNFPDDAKLAVQKAIDIWASNFTSKVQIGRAHV